MTIRIASRIVTLMFSANLLVNTCLADETKRIVDLQSIPARDESVLLQPPANASGGSIRLVHGPELDSAFRLAQADLRLPPAVGDEIHRFDFSIGNLDIFGAGSGRSRTLVIHSGNLNESTTDAVEEDMAIMARILSKMISDQRTEDRKLTTAMGIVIDAKMFALGGGRTHRDIFLDGYGALFVFNVPFPLAPTAEKPEEEKSKASDDTWEKTKRELFGPKQSWSAYKHLLPGSQAVAYDAERVEKLKTNIIEGLKNASNIRALRPDHFVTVTLISPESSKAAKKTVRAEQLQQQQQQNRIVAHPNWDAELAGETLMTFRVKKADIDAFAKGGMNLSQFKEKVTITTY